MMRSDVWLVAAVLASVIAPPAAAQTVVPVDWPRPVYPQVAQSARVTGDVEVAIDVRSDGTVADAEAIAGPFLLRPASEEAARRARFECRGCGDGVTRYVLHVTFRLLPTGCLDAMRQAPQVVSPTQGRVTADVEVTTLIDYQSIAVRSGRCLWLWRCGWKAPVVAPVTSRCPPAVT